MPRIKLEAVESIPKGGRYGSMWTPYLKAFIESDDEYAKLTGVDKMSAQNIRYAACAGNFCVKVYVRDGEIYLSKGDK